jgi:hypothetical protein
VSGGARAAVFGEDGGDLDLSGFEPKLPARPEQVRGVAEQADSAAASQRRRRPRWPGARPGATGTGRHVQLNIKPRAEDIEAFYALADRTGLVLGGVFARAVAAAAPPGRPAPERSGARTVRPFRSAPPCERRLRRQRLARNARACSTSGRPASARDAISSKSA